MNLRSETELAIMALALCPAAAACTRLVDALWLSAGVVFVLAVTRTLTVLAPAGARGTARVGEQAASGPGVWGLFLVSACCAGIFELLLGAAAPAAAARLGIYVPLVAVTVPSMGRLVEHEPPSTNMPGALLDAAARAALFASVLVVVTAFREIVGAGTITLGRTVAVQPFFDDPVRAVGLGGGALICLGYAAGGARMLPSRTASGRGEGGGA